MLPEIKKCADNGDIRGLRYIFDDCLDVDPTFELYKDGWDYSCKVRGFTEPHRELTSFESNQSKWNEDYWIRLKSDLMKNFSKERFEHMIRVAKVYYADKIKRLENEMANELKETTPKQTASPVSSPVSKPVQQNIADSDAIISAQQQQRERDRAEQYRKEQAERDAMFDAEKKKREEERRRKEQEEATKKIVGVAVAAIVIIAVAVILLLK